MAVTGKTIIGLETLLPETDPALWEITTAGAGPQGQLPLTEEMLREWPSGDLFGLTPERRHGLGARASSDATAVPDPEHAGRHPRRRRHARSRSAITPATGRSAC